LSEVASEYGLFGALLLAGFIFGVIPCLIPLVLAPRSRGKKTRDTYECGVDTIGSAWIRFDISYYLFALIFVVFEVDVLYILPVALVFNDSQYVWRDLIELSLFVGILFLAILYAWRKGVLHWRY
jgi:NADH:ubiquinone oxidoreductase subunit 3 (subunit A)